MILGSTMVFSGASGAVAQLGEHFVRNEEVGGSNPPSSTISTDKNWSIRSGRSHVRVFPLHNVMLQTRVE